VDETSHENIITVIIVPCDYLLMMILCTDSWKFCYHLSNNMNNLIIEIKKLLSRYDNLYSNIAKGIHILASLFNCLHSHEKFDLKGYYNNSCIFMGHPCN